MSTKRNLDTEHENSLKKVKVDNEHAVPPPPPPPSEPSPPPPPPPPTEIDDRKPMIEEDNDDDNINNNNNSTNNSTSKSNSVSADDDDEDPAAYIIKSKKNLQKARRDCPYLDTVNRSVLDFDFEKSCSVSFVNLNVYACLVCGKKFQGKSQGSHAHYHCMQSNHHVFINLHNQKIYCLPDDYEVVDPSLDDIKYLVNPTFNKEQIAVLDKSIKYSRALDGSSYLPGFIGLNNIKKNSYINAVIQSIARVAMVRNYFMHQDNLKNSKSALVQNFGELLRKMWNARNFKGHVSPHELTRVVQSTSSKFSISNESDPLEFLQWLLNTLSNDLNVMNESNGNSSAQNIIQQAFSGEVQLTVTPPPKSSDTKPPQPKVSRINFTTLVLDLPPKPVFKDDKDRSIIPQVPLFNLLLKYDGVTPRIQPNGETKLFKLLRLPRYLVLCIKRFTYNNFFKEKEPTIVNFPLKNLDLKDYLSPEVLKTSKSTKYNLLSNIKHEGDPNGGNYTVYLYNKGFDKWFEIQDLSVKETLPQLVAVSEAYILVYEIQL